MRPGSIIAMVLPVAALAGFTAVRAGATRGGLDHAASVTTPSSLARTPEENGRCALRLALSLTGEDPSAALTSAADPQSGVDALLETPEFEEQFARFINSKLNDDPGVKAADDATYWLAKYILVNHRPWHELFDGAYDFTVTPGATPPVAVVASATGLGYFRTLNWMTRYAGNEEAGYRLSSAFRIQQNLIGLDVGAVTTSPGMDISAAGRMNPACSGCHYDSYFALDKVAKILSKKVVKPNGTLTFTPPTESPQTILDGKVIHDDGELVAALLASTDYQFRTCRLAFQFLYGRNEAACEGDLFDACVDAFTASGDIRDALRTLAKDPGYCQ